MGIYIASFVAGQMRLEHSIIWTFEISVMEEGLSFHKMAIMEEGKSQIKVRHFKKSLGKVGPQMIYWET